MEGIPEYINKLEDAQKQSNRVGNPITYPTLLLFTANDMLLTDRFPRSNEILEELDSSNRNWFRWKAIYRKADMAEKVKIPPRVDRTNLGRMVPSKRKVQKGEGYRNC